MKSQEILDLKIIIKRRMEGKLLIRGGRRCIYVITFMEQIIFYNYEGWAQISTTHPRKMFPTKDHGYFHLISTTFERRSNTRTAQKMENFIRDAFRNFGIALILKHYDAKSERAHVYLHP